MNKQVAELIQQMKDEYGDKWARELLFAYEDLGHQDSEEAWRVFSPLFDWIAGMIAAHDALVTALKGAEATLAALSSYTSEWDHLDEATLEQARTALAKAKA